MEKESSKAALSMGFAGKPSRCQREGLAHKRPGMLGGAQVPGAAGMCTGRISELALHTRKRTDWCQKDGRYVRELTKSSGQGVPPPVLQSQKKSQLRYCGMQPEDQRQHFQTRWKPIDGKMAFCTGRRGGSATVECDYEHIDRENTYHTWKRMGNTHLHTGSHLQFDRFLTVEESAKRSDRLPDVKNRNPPAANPDGPFEKPRSDGGNLDRTFVPREDAVRSDDFSHAAKRNLALKSSHLQLSTLHVRPFYLFKFGLWGDPRPHREAFTP
ncbi:uncharacterized protein LOC34623296 [Cyclospora cayetanensis]|uniref:Uncharacterized protein LOC34623296 n=1 Tax=Cyclospora cayetanensis TaxID=88456 RepID=A0A6P6S235_9EIME|nr:uncharacterized protein LOC34623296 [Cyclospora cayetanensis]